MKKSIVLGLLIFPIFIFGQTNVQVFAPKVYFTSSVVSNRPLFDLKNYTFQLTSMRFNPKNEFSIYNKTTQLNDFYGVKKDTFYYRKSVFIPENNIYSPKIDSFNPNGASDFGSAVLAGVINTIVGKF
jgi:hypothetical protein